jgi:hypothetical protein
MNKKSVINLGGTEAVKEHFFHKQKLNTIRSSIDNKTPKSMMILNKSSSVLGNTAKSKLTRRNLPRKLLEIIRFTPGPVNDLEDPEASTANLYEKKTPKKSKSRILKQTSTKPFYSTKKHLIDYNYSKQLLNLLSKKPRQIPKTASFGSESVFEAVGPYKLQSLSIKKK